jgi:hypothetical protein
MGLVRPTIVGKVVRVSLKSGSTRRERARLHSDLFPEVPLGKIPSDNLAKTVRRQIALAGE